MQLLSPLYSMQHQDPKLCHQCYHNPYLLLAILEKSPKDAVNVFIAHLEDSETKVKVLTDEEIPILMDSDPFFNLGYFLEEE